VPCTRLSSPYRQLLSARKYIVLYRIVNTKMSHVAWSACQCVGHTGELSKNRWTDRDAILGAESCGSKESCIRCGHNQTNPFAATRVEKLALWPITLDTCFHCIW